MKTNLRETSFKKFPSNSLQEFSNNSLKVFEATGGKREMLAVGERDDISKKEFLRNGACELRKHYFCLSGQQMF